MDTRDELSHRPTLGGRDSGTEAAKTGQGAGHVAGHPGAPTLKELAAQVLARSALRDSKRDSKRDSAGRGCPAVAGCVGQTDAERWRYLFHERAGIREHDGGMSRSDAEAKALRDCAAQWRCEHPLPVNGPTDACAHCGRPMTVEDRTPVLSHPGRHAWLHRFCWAPMNEARQRDAEHALRLLLGFAP